MKYIKAFSHFWWDFLIGDTPELFVATLLVVGCAYLLRHVHLGWIALPPLAIAFLLASVVRKWKQKESRP